MARSGWAITDSKLHAQRSNCKHQVHYQKGQDHSIAFTLDCKFHQDCIYSCPYSTQLMGLGSWQEAGLGPSPHCLASRWEGTQESCPLGSAHHTTLFSPSRELELSSTLGFWCLPPIHFSGFQVPRCFWKLGTNPRVQLVGRWCPVASRGNAGETVTQWKKTRMQGRRRRQRKSRSELNSLIQKKVCLSSSLLF